MASSYKPNDKGFAEFALSPEMRKILAEVAEKGKEYAETISEPFRKTGDYASKFGIVEASVKVTARDGAIPWRAAAILENTSDHAAAVEVGNRGHKAHHVLARTAEFLGTSG
jgi:hypothetical protein